MRIKTILQTPSRHHYYENRYAIINQINKHTVKIYNQCAYTQIIIKKFHNYIKKNFIHQI